MDTVVERARQAAQEVLYHNAEGPFNLLPRAAGWGYPEPYTRDLMISSLGFLVCEDDFLIGKLRLVLESLAKSQSPLGQIPSLAHDPGDLGSSDATPLFLLGLGFYRKALGEVDFLSEAAQKALLWMQYQSPQENHMIAQQPTSDWRDEQWVLGFGLYVNSLVYSCLRLYELDHQAEALRTLIKNVDIRSTRSGRVIHEGLQIPDKPYYALWAYKMYHNERFDLLGNSLAILSGLTSREQAQRIIAWIKATCNDMQARGELFSPELPPCLIPFISPGDQDWYPRLELFNKPGEYHNGGIWPFICGFYIAALVAAGEYTLAEEALTALAVLVQEGKRGGVSYGFNEWHQAQDGSPQGQDWQTWSAALFLYASVAVENRSTPFFDEIRFSHPNGSSDDGYN